MKILKDVFGSFASRTRPFRSPQPNCGKRKDSLLFKDLFFYPCFKTILALSKSESCLYSKNVCRFSEQCYKQCNTFTRAKRETYVSTALNKWYWDSLGINIMLLAFFQMWYNLALAFIIVVNDTEKKVEHELTILATYCMYCIFCRMDGRGGQPANWQN